MHHRIIISKITVIINITIIIIIIMMDRWIDGSMDGTRGPLGGTRKLALCDAQLHRRIIGTARSLGRWCRPSAWRRRYTTRGPTQCLCCTATLQTRSTERATRSAGEHCNRTLHEAVTPSNPSVPPRIAPIASVGPDPQWTP